MATAPAIMLEWGMQESSASAIAREATCRAILREWTPEGLARGIVADNPDSPLPPGTAIEVLGGIPGEEVEVTLRWPAIWSQRQRRRPHPPLVRLSRVLAPAPERVPAPCPAFGDCGGCRLQQIPYSAQLAWKRDRVAAELAAVGLADVPVSPTVGMAEPWGFRNQMRFAVNRAGQLGLTALGTHRVIPLRACPIAHPAINGVLAALSDASHPRPQVLVRCGTQTGDVLVQPAPSQEQRSRLAAAGIAVRTDDLRERLGGLPFQMRPSSFFQTNTALAEVMARLVLAAVPAGPDITIVDAFCGVGTFAALLAQRAGHVIAIEESASAVRDARENLAALGLDRVEVRQGKTEQLLPQIGDRIDAVVLDPPRMGCQPAALDALIARRVPRVIYVSCDPATLARDLARVCRGGFRLDRVQPLDMFPQTYHIEAVATLDFIA
jgi:23S rRNA (uracil1939-C5)-methyltransferase